MIRNFILNRSFNRYLTHLNTHSLATNQPNNKQFYIPIRPLKDDRTLIYSIGRPPIVPLFTRLLIFTPFIAFSLEGLINDWSLLVIGGTAVSLMLAMRAEILQKYMKSHEIIELRVDKNVTKFQITLINNSLTNKIEDQIMKYNKTSFTQFFKRQLKNKTIDLPEGKAQQLLSLTPPKLQREITMLRASRKQIVMQISKEQIQKIQFISERQMGLILRANRYGKTDSKGKLDTIFEGYDTEKAKKNVMAIHIKNINNNFRFTLLLNVERNLQKKYEEYIQAIGQGKTILNPTN